MADSRKIKAIKSNYERVIQGLTTQVKQFIYLNTGGFVNPGTIYSVYYLPSKKVVYLTGMISSSNSR